MDADEIRKHALCQMERLCRYLLPNGRKEGCHWRVGSVMGERGSSFDVNLNTGVFGDWADGKEMQSGGIDLWMAVRRVDFRIAKTQLTEWLGFCDSLRPSPCDPLDDRTERNLGRIGTIATKGILLPNLVKPAEEDLRRLSKSRSICIEALQIARNRGFLWCFDDELNGRCWVYTDERRLCAVRRRIDNKLFRLRNGKYAKAAACPGSKMGTPLGYHEALPYPCIGIAEGGPNSLAIIAHSWASGVEDRVAPICMPSASANFTPAVLACLQRKRARIFIDDDKAGQEASERWATQLKRAQIITDGFSFAGLTKDNGDRAKDLNDLLVIDYDCWERYRDSVEGVLNFAFERGEDAARNR